eukprot:CAMPEP_0197685648 /NCGR_PEP_ID=MMETSP1338-20131121/101239_1 /TAXON_ID=43686 ORGANISM="Pelagodinium beii, Strain RCC1491" /NCGR_SAMPLE_ID=MMETSP1338 /ASSEMBLY_ACC=CAM_ASM_000754 /LENGTH=39 /DNA_ID= /DNA_START= /DNA_END= /DNA_ORIENTATION=
MAASSPAAMPTSPQGPQCIATPGFPRAVLCLAKPSRQEL